MATAKEEVEALLGKLPNDCSLEDIQYHLYVLEKGAKRNSSRGERRDCSAGRS